MPLEIPVSSTKHAVLGDSGRIRRLVPDELDQIQMFPKGWTATEGGKPMSDGHRAFCRGIQLMREEHGLEYDTVEF